MPTGYNSALVPFFIRVFLGILFFFQGYDKVFKVGVKGVADAFETPMRQHAVGRPLLITGAAITSYVEMIGGLLLIVGLFRQYTLYALGFDLLIATLGFSIMQPVWDLQHVFRRFLLIIILLMIPAAWDTICLDYFIR
jgi:putative oxidoreductase